MTKSPRVVWTVAVYFLLGSITVGGGVVRCSIQVTISLSQPGAYEVVGELPPKSHPTTASNTNPEARASFTRETLPGLPASGKTIRVFPRIVSVRALARRLRPAPPAPRPAPR